jgi:hypothetical protein
MKASCFIAIIFCLLACSCATYTVSFVTAPAPNQKVNKAYILVVDSLPAINYWNANNTFLKNLSQTVSDSLTRRGVKNYLKVYSSVFSLETYDDITLQENNYAPDVIISIKREQSNLISGKYGSYYNGGLYLVTLSSPGNKKPYWKSIVQIQNEREAIYDDYSALTAQIMSKLQADGIICRYHLPPALPRLPACNITQPNTIFLTG